MGWGEEMKIKSKRSHIIDTSGTAPVFIGPRLRSESGSPCVFPLASRKQAGPSSLSANLWLVCIVQFLGMTDLLNHPWLSQLAFNHMAHLERG